VYALKPVRVYYLDEVQEDPRMVARMERMIGAMHLPETGAQPFSRDEVPAVIEDLMAAWTPEMVFEHEAGSWGRPVVFTVQDLDDTKPEYESIVERLPEGAGLGHVHRLLGHIDTARCYHEREDDWEKNFVCWPTKDFGTMNGCPHGCQYCGAGKTDFCTAVGLNIEDFMEVAVPRVVAERPWQKCFRMIGWAADHIAWEPEYGVIDLFTRKLAELDRFGYFHSTSANVEWLADVAHRDRLIGIWSTTCESVAREIEPGSGAAIDRIRAAARCEEMGIPVRFKFKPMIPVRNWREEYAEIIEQMCALTTPESIGFCVVMWNTLDSLAARIDLGLLDQDYVRRARDAEEEMKGVITGPFPHDVRAEIYHYLTEQVRRWDSDVPLYISTESREMWDEMTEALGQRPESFFCGCSPIGLPGRKLAASKDCPALDVQAPRRGAGGGLAIEGWRNDPVALKTCCRLVRRR
jgi:hypothetical protein